MKNNKGITLISLILYVILLTFIVAILSSITATFYTNMNEFDTESESAVAYSKFNMYFLKDIKSEGAKIEEFYDNYIVISYINKEETFTDENMGVIISGEGKQYVEYLVQDNVLYRNKIKICEDVNEARITADMENQIAQIYFKIGDYQKTTNYVIESLKNTDNNNIEI